MTTKYEAFKAIDAERNYQQKRWYWDNKSGFHSVGGYITLIRYYSSKADETWHDHGDRAALNQIRKIGALAVACLEENGLVARGANKISIVDRRFIYQAIDTDLNEHWKLDFYEVGDYLTYLKNRIDRLEEAWIIDIMNHDKKHVIASRFIRHIIIICVLCMEKCGIVERESNNGTRRM